MKLTLSEASHDYKRIEKVIRFLEANFDRHPELSDIARSAHLSEFHFQKLFTRWVGISPKRFLQFLTKEHAKRLLAESRDLLSTTYESGLSSPGRLHDLFVACEAMSPGEFKQKGENLSIVYGFHPTPFGECLIASTDRGICGMSFVQADGRTKTLATYQAQWPEAKFIKDDKITGGLAERVFTRRKNIKKIPLLLGGTNFQIKVWEALLRIPEGALVSYQEIANYIGKPKSVRAVGTAIGSNPVAYLIPCHRVIREMGLIGGYRWGGARKKAILAWESAKTQPIISAKAG